MEKYLIGYTPINVVNIQEKRNVCSAIVLESSDYEPIMRVMNKIEMEEKI